MKTICIIVPVHNEEENIAPMHEALVQALEPMKSTYAFSMLFVNDGSTDDTLSKIEALSKKDAQVHYIDFSRNFGKEIATTAGINNCKADACILIDGDLQHPVELIPEFIKKWEEGSDVVVGVRKKSMSDGILKRIGSKLFYTLINSISEVEILPNATDYRLLDRVVMDEFNRFTETSRMTRALIDWLGFHRAYVYFEAKDRVNGQASYSYWKLLRLALSSFISLSLVPLQFAGYFGMFITLTSGIIGLYILVGKYFLHWRFASTFSDSENLAIFIVFLVGIILISIGLIALYIANIHEEVINRPMYIVRKKNIE